MATSYRFIGAGAGIPGLPHEVSDEQARELGLEETLRAAMAAGTYEEVIPVSVRRGGEPAQRREGGRLSAGPTVVGEGE